MGCVSSKHFRQDLKREVHFNNGGECVNHLVSLTSSTYGHLNLDNEKPIEEHCVAESRMVQKSPPPEEPEVINAWELMQDLEEGMPISNTQAKKSPKPRAFLRGFVGFDAKSSPLKFSNQIGSPKKAKRFAGKENKGRVNLFGRSDYSPKGILKTKNNTEDSCNAALNLSYPVKGSPIGAQKRDSPGSDSGLSSRRKSFSPLFDPELLASYEKELSEEEEQIKMMVSPTAKFRKTRNSRGLESILHLFEMKCPPSGENAVVIYTTTLRGIRKTFEDCNNVRSIIESHCIQVMERDVSMDSGFKEELRGLMETKQVKVPLLFVKGRLIGGVDVVVKLEEEGKLSSLLDGIPRAIGGCKGCAGVRFVMCMGCSGSCKVLDGEQMKMVRCGECNENGLIHCPICC